MPRSIWSGAITFGLVTIPVKLFTAARDHTVSFHMLSPDGTCRLRRKLVCPETGEEYDFQQTARGYEVAPGQYVILRDDELDKLKPEKGRAIHILDFVSEGEIDPVYYDRPYYLAPEGAGAKAYRLLMEVMRKSGMVAVAKFTFHSKEYLAALRPEENLILLETMRYADEVVPPEEVGGLPERAELDPRELAAAEQLVEALSGKFDPAKYRDTYRNRVMDLIEAKSQGRQLKRVTEEDEPPRVINLMEALQKSLKQTKAGHGQGAGSTRKGASGASRRRKSA